MAISLFLSAFGADVPVDGSPPGPCPVAHGYNGSRGPWLQWVPWPLVTMGPMAHGYNGPHGPWLQWAPWPLIYAITNFVEQIKHQI